VYGAVIASTLTTVAVFLPIIFMREEAGQLFKDIAIAITAAILLSLLVSVTMIPTAMNRVYGRDERKKKSDNGALDRMGGRLVDGITAVSAFFRKTVPARLACVIGFTALALLIAWALMPKAEYLPQGNQNIIMSILVPPPGYSESKRREIGDYIFSQIKPYMEVDGNGRHSPDQTHLLRQRGHVQPGGHGPDRGQRNPRPGADTLDEPHHQFPAGHVRRQHPAGHLPDRPGPGPHRGRQRLR
jgi:hypothetical protein